MDIILAFDVEDFATPEAADGQKWWAEHLGARGLRGSFQMVAEVIRAHRRRGREDVLDALARHEIGYHTDTHSIPPTHPHALEGVPLPEAVEWVLRHEAAGLAEVTQTFGRVPISYCPPGGSWTPATMIALAALGVKIWTGSLAFSPSTWWCGMLTRKYDLAFERFFAHESETEADEAFYAQAEAVLNRCGPAGTAVFMSHPAILACSDFWDRALFDAKPLTIDAVPPAPVRPAAAVDRLQKRIARWLDWLVARPGARVIDFATYYNERSLRRRDLASLLAETGLTPPDAGRLPLREPDPDTCIPESFERLSHGKWGPLPQGFTGEKLKEQARLLLWTAAPAVRNVERGGAGPA